LLIVTASREHEPATSYQRLLRSRYIDGAVVMETQDSRSPDLHRQLSLQRYPWVVLGYPVGMVPCYCVHADDLQGA
jgi:DNA-binding LacI/PurR family transcriptional regulator